MKRIVPFLMSICILLTCRSIAIASYDQPSPPTPTPTDGSSQTYEEAEKKADYSSYCGSGLLEATDEEMQYWALKNALRPDNSDAGVDTDAILASWVYLDPFTYYQQNIINSCTIACLRMAFKYVHGSTPTESTIQATTGVPCSIGDATNYFNNYTTDYQYYAKYGASKATMKDDLYSCISAGAPPIIGLKLTSSDGWPFDLACHAVAIYSAMSDKSRFAMCDPWAGYVGEPGWRWYDRDADKLFSAYDAVNAGYMY